MKLIVEELVTNLQQKITVGATAQIIKHIRPHIYKHLAPAGSLKVQILNSSQTLIVESSAVTIASITTASGNYCHGYVKFDINAVLAPETDYYIRLTSTGYTYSNSAFIGWCKDFDLRHYDADYTPSSGILSAFDMELWGLRNEIKGIL